MAFIFMSCNKSSDNNSCPGTSNTTIYTNHSVIYDGATLSMSTSLPGSNPNTFQWTGPGNWTSNQQIVVRTNMQSQDAGVYTIKVYNFNNCLIYTGSSNIQVTPAPPPPCTVTNNTITSTPFGIVNYNFPSGISTYPYQSNYYYTGVTATNDRIDISFSGSHIPYPGIYRSVILLPAQEDYVYIVINTSTGTQYRSKGGDDLYVNNVGGKMVVTFCNFTMYDFGNPNNLFTLTGKLSPF